MSEKCEKHGGVAQIWACCAMDMVDRALKMQECEQHQKLKIFCRLCTSVQPPEFTLGSGSGSPA